MKRLILVRHAKSSWDEPGIPDKDRPLNARGREAAKKVGRWLEQQELGPDEVICSAALRCQETWDRIAPALKTEAAVRIEDGLYLADENKILSVLKTASGDNVLIIAHMPGIGDFAREMRRDPPPQHEIFGKYPTGAVTVLDFNIDDWTALLPGTGVVRSYITPREL